MQNEFIIATFRVIPNLTSFTTSLSLLTREQIFYRLELINYCHNFSFYIYFQFQFIDSYAKECNDEKHSSPHK